MWRSTKDRGTDNVLVDLGFADAEDLAARTVLAKKINDILSNRNLTQLEVAELLGMPQPKASAIRNYRLRSISSERLRQALSSCSRYAAER
jgi:predicted XRE-type DNA-binding protein